MNKQLNEITEKFICGEVGLNATNEALKPFGFHIDPTRQLFSASELLEATGDTAETATGFGILHDGIGPEKVEVRQGKLLRAVFDPVAWAQNAPGAELPCYEFYFRGKKYTISNDGVSLAGGEPLAGKGLYEYLAQNMSGNGDAYRMIVFDASETEADMLHMIIHPEGRDGKTADFLLHADGRIEAQY